MPDAAPVTETSARPRLLLLDGHSIAYRAFFALPVENFSTTTGYTDGDPVYLSLGVGVGF